jgi:hypothetical protein
MLGILGKDVPVLLGAIAMLAIGLAGNIVVITRIVGGM